MKKIEVMGAGCAKCHEVEEKIRQFVDAMGYEAEIIVVKDLDEIVDRGIMITPAVAVDGELKKEGQIPGDEEIRSWFA